MNIKMAKLICSAKDIGFTILPISFDAQELTANSSDYLLGYVTYNSETDERKFTYTESGVLTESKNHWSLTILKELPYCEQEGPWIVYNCSPEKGRSEFNKIIKNSGESLHIYNWDIWSVEGKNAKVAVVTSYDAY
jgi:hypothetical protein